jgi:hypothetical protein
MSSKNQQPQSPQNQFSAQGGGATAPTPMPKPSGVSTGKFQTPEDPKDGMGTGTAGGKYQTPQPAINQFTPQGAAAQNTSVAPQTGHGSIQEYGLEHQIQTALGKVGQGKPGTPAEPAAPGAPAAPAAPAPATPAPTYPHSRTDGEANGTQPAYRPPRAAPSGPTAPGTPGSGKLPDGTPVPPKPGPFFSPMTEEEQAQIAQWQAQYGRYA